jgi:hypothetical protein
MRRVHFTLPIVLAVIISAAPSAQAEQAGPSLEQRVNESVRMLANEPRFKGISDEERRARIEFVTGNVLYALVHEVGHMLIQEMGLPVLGREEDAADQFATITGIKMGDAFSTRVLTASARGWFLSDKRNQAENIQMQFYDEHGLDRQRAYNIVCLMVGSDPEKFDALAEMTQIPPERRATCQGDYSNAMWSWGKALEPHLRKQNQPKTKITVTYQDSEEYELFVRGFKNLHILETVADHLADRYVWRRPIGLEMMTCNEPAARWDISVQKIIVCYELAADFAQLYRDYGAKQPVAQKP